jgi:hypothetical protein
MSPSYPTAPNLHSKSFGACRKNSPTHNILGMHPAWYAHAATMKSVFVVFFWGILEKEHITCFVDGFNLYLMKQ